MRCSEILGMWAALCAIASAIPTDNSPLHSRLLVSSRSTSATGLSRRDILSKGSDPGIIFRPSSDSTTGLGVVETLKVAQVLIAIIGRAWILKSDTFTGISAFDEGTRIVQVRLTYDRSEPQTTQFMGYVGIAALEEVLRNSDQLIWTRPLQFDYFVRGDAARLGHFVVDRNSVGVDVIYGDQKNADAATRELTGASRIKLNLLSVGDPISVHTYISLFFYAIRAPVVQSHDYNDILFEQYPLDERAEISDFAGYTLSIKLNSGPHDQSTLVYKDLYRALYATLIDPPEDYFTTCVIRFAFYSGGPWFAEISISPTRSKPGNQPIQGMSSRNMTQLERNGTSITAVS